MVLVSNTVRVDKAAAEGEMLEAGAKRVLEDLSEGDERAFLERNGPSGEACLSEDFEHGYFERVADETK